MMLRRPEQYLKQQQELINCYYDDNLPNSNVTYTPHYGRGTMMLLPILMNYLICWYVWVTTDKRKAVTWVAALLSFYPQFVACKIIYLIWCDPKKGLQKKQHLERNMVQMESFHPCHDISAKKTRDGGRGQRDHL